MTWLYVVVASAALARWGLWHFRDVVEWFEEPRRDYVSPATVARLRLYRDRGTYPVPHASMLSLRGEAGGGSRGA